MSSEKNTGTTKQKRHKSVLILDGFSRQVLPMQRSFYKSGYHVAIAAPHRFCAGFFSRYVHKKIIWPSLYKNEEETLSELIRYLENNKTDIVLGLSDKTAGLISKHQEKINQQSCIATPPYERLARALDKIKTMQFCMMNNIPCPITINGGVKEIEGLESKIQFPIINKPNRGWVL